MATTTTTTTWEAGINFTIALVNYSVYWPLIGYLIVWRHNLWRDFNNFSAETFRNNLKQRKNIFKINNYVKMFLIIFFRNFWNLIFANFYSNPLKPFLIKDRRLIFWWILCWPMQSIVCRLIITAQHSCYVT